MDPYVYAGTRILKNVRHIRDAEVLSRFEADMSSRRLVELAAVPMDGRFDAQHLQSIHRYIFQDVYPWAGELRTVNISKPGALFALQPHVASSLENVCSNLKDERFLDGLDRASFCKRGAHYLGELNAIHPFRDGNGRAQREFIRQLAMRNGYELDWSKCSRDEMFEASRESFRRGNEGLAKILTRCLS